MTLEHVAAFLILWAVLSVVIGILLGTALHRCNPSRDVETTDWAAWEQEANQP